MWLGNIFWLALPIVVNKHILETFEQCIFGLQALIL